MKTSIGPVLTLLVLLAGLHASAAGEETKQLKGHVPAITKSLKPLGSLPADNELWLAIGLPLRDPAALSNFLADVYNPASPRYRHWLTPAEFTARFSATEADYGALKKFAVASGFRVAHEHGNRVLLDVTATAADIERAFKLKLLTYQHPTEARQFFAPDREPSVPANLAVVDIQGLNDYTKPHPRVRKRTASTQPALPRSGTAPDSSGEFFGKDYRNAYAPGVTLTGAGQSVGLLEWDGYYAKDIQAYATLAGGGRTNILVQAVLIDNFNGKVHSAGNNAEVSLDIEMAMAMAPGLKAIYSFENYSGAWNDTLNEMAASNNILNLSCSWGYASPSPSADVIYQQMMAQGQTFFDAVGDVDAFTLPATNSVNGVDDTNADNAPADCPYIVQVGGTSLVMNGAGASYNSESVWNDGHGVGSSGGVSGYYRIPWWQTNTSMAHNGGSTAWRNTPDVAMQAEEDNFIIYDNKGSNFNSNYNDGWGGTSFAAPLWAGFTALMNQQASNNGTGSVGFINPAVYAIGNSANYANCFHDITSGNNEWSASPNQYVAVAGYDLCTGWGSPVGQSLINALAGVTSTPPISTLKFTSRPVLSVTSLLFSATNAGAGTVYLLTSTNLEIPIDEWMPIWTNVLVASGAFSTNLPNAVIPSAAQQFYILSTTNK